MSGFEKRDATTNGRMELMPEYMRKKFDDFVRKVKVYEQEKGIAL